MNVVLETVCVITLRMEDATELYAELHTIIGNHSSPVLKDLFVELGDLIN